MCIPAENQALSVSVSMSLCLYFPSTVERKWHIYECCSIHVCVSLEKIQQVRGQRSSSVVEHWRSWVQSSILLYHFPSFKRKKGEKRKPKTNKKNSRKNIFLCSDTEYGNNSRHVLLKSEALTNVCALPPAQRDALTSLDTPHSSCRAWVCIIYYYFVVSVCRVAF